MVAVVQVTNYIYPPFPHPNKTLSKTILSVISVKRSSFDFYAVLYCWTCTFTLLNRTTDKDSPPVGACKKSNSMAQGNWYVGLVLQANHWHKKMAQAQSQRRDDRSSERGDKLILGVSRRRILALVHAVRRINGLKLRPCALSIWQASSPSVQYILFVEEHTVFYTAKFRRIKPYIYLPLCHL